jgi:hypothetical protein
MLLRGKKAIFAPLRLQIEQLQVIASLISPSTSNFTFPQWQLP